MNVQTYVPNTRAQPSPAAGASRGRDPADGDAPGFDALVEGRETTAPLDGRAQEGVMLREEAAAQVAADAAPSETTTSDDHEAQDDDPSDDRPAQDEAQDAAAAIPGHALRGLLLALSPLQNRPMDIRAPSGGPARSVAPQGKGALWSGAPGLAAQGAPEKDLGSTRRVPVDPVSVANSFELSQGAPVEILSAKLETHLQPMGFDPGWRQVATRIESTLAPAFGAEQGGALSGATPSMLPNAPRTPIQVLRLQLQPLDLGQVEVRLHLRAGEIHVRISAESPGTRLQLEADRDRLSLALKGKGYDVQSIVIAQDGPDATRTDTSARATQDEPGRQRQQEGREQGYDARDKHQRRENAHARDRSDRRRDNHDQFAE